MSTATPAPSGSTPAPSDPTPGHPTPGAPPPLDLPVSSVPLTRLVRVELRKSMDTRAGRWLAGVILGLCVLVVGVTALAAPAEVRGLEMLLTFAGGTLTTFLPVLVILLVTSEWSQRTALVTFTLEPHRPRIVLAKLLAGLVLSVVVIALAFVVAVLGALLTGTRGPIDWEVDPLLVLNAFGLGTLIVVLVGFAIAMLTMNTPAAIVLYFAYLLVLPSVVGALGFFFDWFADLAPWIELNTAQIPLGTGDYVPSGTEWAQLATAALIWLVLPFVLGLLRLLRAEVK